MLALSELLRRCALCSPPGSLRQTTTAAAAAAPVPAACSTVHPHLPRPPTPSLSCTSATSPHYRMWGLAERHEQFLCLSFRSLKSNAVGGEDSLCGATVSPHKLHRSILAAPDKHSPCKSVTVPHPPTATSTQTRRARGCSFLLYWTLTQDRYTASSLRPLASAQNCECLT